MDFEKLNVSLFQQMLKLLMCIFYGFLFNNIKSMSNNHLQVTRTLYATYLVSLYVQKYSKTQLIDDLSKWITHNQPALLQVELEMKRKSHMHTEL